VENPHFYGVFTGEPVKNSVFPVFFADSLLRSQKALAIVPSGSDFLVPVV
jgi:hypothetical protein